MITANDVIVALSWSGETVELKSLINYSRRFRIPLIAVTADAASALARAADIALVLPQAREACPLNLAPPPRRSCSSRSATRWRLRCWKAAASRRWISAICIRAGGSAPRSAFTRDLMHGGAAMPLEPAGTKMYRRHRGNVRQGVRLRRHHG